MGGFANSVFNLLMGWLRTAAFAVWGLLSGEGGSDFFAWLGDNWLALAIAICVICTMIDMLIHLIRWRPYKVWASFFRRISGRESRERRSMQYAEPAQERWQEPEQPEAEEWVYPEPVREQPVPPPVITPQEEQDAYRSRFARPVEQQITYRRPPAMRRLQYQAIANAAQEDAQTPAGYPMPAEEVPAEPTMQHTIVPAAAQEEQRESLAQQMRRRMTQLQKNFGMTETEDDSEESSEENVEMYHAPVYPPDWQQQQTMQVTPRRRRQHSEINSDA